MTFEIYQDRVGEWRWRIVAVNGKTVADSSEGYSSQSNAKRAVLMMAHFGELLSRAGVDVVYTTAGRRPIAPKKGSASLEIGVALTKSAKVVLKASEKAAFPDATEKDDK